MLLDDCMSKPKTDLNPRIREKSLELLLEEELEEISTRDIAKACGVMAARLYYYYKDRETLFTEVKLVYIEELAKTVFDHVVKVGLSESKDTLLDASLYIAILWGAIESVFLNQTIPQYWSRCGGIDFTNKMIDLFLTSLTRDNQQKGSKGKCV
jgi:AcrR family transcriptional regulator